jgi:hypothetical protein
MRSGRDRGQAAGANGAWVAQNRESEHGTRAQPSSSFGRRTCVGPARRSASSGPGWPATMTRGSDAARSRTASRTRASRPPVHPRGRSPPVTKSPKSLRPPPMVEHLAASGRATPVCPPDGPTAAPATPAVCRPRLRPAARPGPRRGRRGLAGRRRVLRQTSPHRLGPPPRPRVRHRRHRLPQVRRPHAGSRCCDRPGRHHPPTPRRPRSSSPASPSSSWPGPLVPRLTLQPRWTCRAVLPLPPPLAANCCDGPG